MGVSPSDARSLTLAEYQGMLFHHNLRADPEGKNTPVEPLSIEDAEEMDRHYMSRFGEVMH